MVKKLELYYPKEREGYKITITLLLALHHISSKYHCYTTAYSALPLLLLPLLYMQVHSIVFCAIAVFIEGILLLHRFPTIEAAL